MMLRVLLALLVLPAALALESQQWARRAKPPQTDAAGRPKMDPAARKALAKALEEAVKAKYADWQGIFAKIESDFDEKYWIQKSDIDQALKLLIQLDRNGPKHNARGGGGGRARFVEHPDHKDRQYTVFGIPQAGGGMWLTLHGGPGGTPEANAPHPPGPCIGPLAPNEVTAWNNEPVEQFVIELIHASKRTWGIDTNKVWLVGHSMGGYGTWNIGTIWADQFAAIGPMAGGLVYPPLACNLKNTPIYFYHSLDDRQVGPESDQQNHKNLTELKDRFGPYDFVYREYNGIGHGYPSDLGEMYKWIASKTRNPYPKMVVFLPFRPYKRLMWWLKVPGNGRSGRAVAKVGTGNKIDVLESPGGVEIFLNEKMGISLAKDVIVTKNGAEVYKGKPGYSLSALVESFVQNRDPNHYYYAKIKVP